MTALPRKRRAFCCDLFPDSAVRHVNRSPHDWPGGKAGDVVLVEFTLMGRAMSALNGGPDVSHNEAVSLQVLTDTQQETDRYWHALTANGGEESMCSWCHDRWGVRWQIVPRVLMEGMRDPDPAVVARVQSVTFTMTKIDIAAIEAARAG